MKSWFWTLVGIGIGATITYILLNKEKESENEVQNESYPLFVMQKAKRTINDQIYAGVEINDEEEWI